MLLEQLRNSAVTFGLLSDAITHNCRHCIFNHVEDVVFESFPLIGIVKSNIQAINTIVHSASVKMTNIVIYDNCAPCEHAVLKYMTGAKHNGIVKRNIFVSNDVNLLRLREHRRVIE